MSHALDRKRLRYVEVRDSYKSRSLRVRKPPGIGLYGRGGKKLAPTLLPHGRGSHGAAALIQAAKNLIASRDRQGAVAPS
jgi:hypothetical protein